MKEGPRSAWKSGATLEEVAQNSDGTWNGIRALSAISGLDPREVQWMWRRMQELKAAGCDATAMKLAVREESALKPWLNAAPGP